MNHIIDGILFHLHKKRYPSRTPLIKLGKEGKLVKRQELLQYQVLFEKG